MNISYIKRLLKIDIYLMIPMVVIILLFNPEPLVKNLVIFMVLVLPILFFIFLATIGIIEKKIEHWGGTISIANNKKLYCVYVCLYITVAIVLITTLVKVCVEFVHGKF